MSMPRLRNAGRLLPQMARMAALLSAVVVPPAQAQDILPGTAYAMAVVFSRGLADEPTATDLKPSDVVSAADDHIAPKVQNWIMRQMISHKEAPVNLALAGGEAVQVARPEPAADAAPAAEPLAPIPERGHADPNFDRWQRDANEKLTHEVDQTKRKENPLALAHPDSFVVACEAGCRYPKDHIIYMVLKSAASTRRLDVASSDVAQVGTPLQSAQAPAVEEVGSLPCVAGCYDSEQPKKRQVVNNADARDGVRPGVVLASLVTTSSTPEPASLLPRSYQTHGSIRNPDAEIVKRKGSLVVRSRRLTRQLAQHAKTERLQRAGLPGRHFEKVTRIGNPAHNIRRVTNIAYRFHR